MRNRAETGSQAILRMTYRAAIPIIPIEHQIRAGNGAAPELERRLLLQYAVKLGNRSKMTGVIMGLLAVVVVLSSAAVVATTSAHHEGDNAIHACVNNQTGEVRAPADGECRQSESEIDLAQAGVTSDVIIINDEYNPVPVSGQVQAEQSGEWTVDLDGGGITAELPVVTKSFNGRYDLDPLSYDDVSVDVNLPELIYASQVIVTSSNDNLVVTLFEGSKKWADIGTVYTDVPDVMTLPFTQKVPVDRFSLFCGNLIQDCEVTITILGN
jgi:hypothetical protein